VTYYCRKGCIYPDDHSMKGQPKRHQNKSECPFEPVFGEKPPVPAEPLPVPKEQPIPTKPRVSVRPMNLAAPGQQPTQSRLAAIIHEPVPEYWVLDAEGARKAWRMAFGGVYYAIEKTQPYVCDWLEYPKASRPPLPERSKFELGISANEAANDQTSIIVKWPSEVLKWAGANSLEEAKMMLDEIEFFSILGTVIIETGGYYATLYLESPKYLKAKKAEEDATKARQGIAAKPIAPTPATRPTIETTATLQEAPPLGA
jgi:hypothetical protein